MSDQTADRRSPGTDGPGKPPRVDHAATPPPVDDHTYDVLQALTSTLEAIEANTMYADADDTGLFNELLADHHRHARLLLDELRVLIVT